MMKTIATASVAFLLLHGCASVSFAPPNIERSTKLARVPNKDCIPQAARMENNDDIEIQPDVIGALDLIENFDLTYTCAAAEAADGRQIFEIPSFLATAVGLAGASFGLGTDQILATGVSAAVLNGGKSYFAPKAKAGVLHSAITAVNCIRTESVGISYFRQRSDDKPSNPVRAFEVKYQELLETDSRRGAVQGNITNLTQQRVLTESDQKKQREFEYELQALDMIRGVQIEQLQNLATRAVVTDTVKLDAERQYFEMVKGALSAVHGILGERLRDAGAANLDDVYAKLKQLAEEHIKQEKALQDAKKNANNAVAAMGNDSSARMLADRAVRETVTLENKVVQVQLQACVLQARA